MPVDGVPNKTIGAIMFGLVNQSSNPIFTLDVPGRTGVIGMSPCPGVRLESPVAPFANRWHERACGVV